MSRLFFLSIMLFASTVNATTSETTDETAWPALKQHYFGDKIIHVAEPEMLQLEAPKRAEDAAVVPIRISSNLTPTETAYIQRLHLFIDNNPMPYSANFLLSPKLGEIDIATRVRVDRYTPIRAIAEMNDGRLYMVSDYIKATGGCSAPAGKDPSAAMARLGKMQLRMRPVVPGDMTPVQLIISHPNNSGLQIDQASRGYIPPHYVEKIDIRVDDESLIQLESGISISEDPSIRFMFTPEKSGTLSVDVTDSKGGNFTLNKSF
ncbi:quinoprotein dehydrogenase-associated SoxYZ-like carrier [Methylophaga frappieri]|nr:quinoprotein dehydrogenase-associated SoxYZ-like carrier [Methylophaga frappieri]